MTEPLSETHQGSISLDVLEGAHFNHVAAGKTVVALGPGLSRHPESAQFARTLFQRTQTPIVVDADGLNAFEAKPGELAGAGRVLVITPHPGEMARLTGKTIAQIQADRIGSARAFAQEHSCIVVLKGHRTVVALPGGAAFVNPTGNAGMATGGTGDILTGLVAGFLAQFPDNPAGAVCAAVFLHGLAGDCARDAIGEHAMVATDLLRFTADAFRLTRKWAAGKLARVN